jgi:hypothetical protein
MAEKCCYNIFNHIFWGKRRRRQEKMKTKENKIMVKLFFFSKLPFFCTYVKKTHTRPLFDAWSFLVVHIWLTPSEGPKDFVNWSLKRIGP